MEQLMWPTTRVTKLLNIKLPIIQAPMAGGITTAKLIAAVSNAGGLGSLGAGYMSPEEIRRGIQEIKSLTDQPFAVNLFIPEKSNATTKQIDHMTKVLKKVCGKVTNKINLVHPPYVYAFNEQLQAILEEKIAVFSFVFGIPNKEWIVKLKKNKIKLMGTATTLSEARLLQKHDSDLIVVQGFEAGGHRASFTDTVDNALIGNLALIPQIVDQIKTPVIAAGGIMDARGILAALVLGASAVQMGTAFITCQESGAHPDYKKALLTLTNDNTTLTRSFTGKFARGIKNEFIDKMLAYQADILDYPIQHALTKQVREIAAQKGLINYMSLWAGQAAALSEQTSVTQFIQNLNRDIKKLMSLLR